MPTTSRGPDELGERRGSRAGRCDGGSPRQCDGEREESEAGRHGVAIVAAKRAVYAMTFSSS